MGGEFVAHSSLVVGSAANVATRRVDRQWTSTVDSAPSIHSVGREVRRQIGWGRVADRHGKEPDRLLESRARSFSCTQ